TSSAERIQPLTLPNMDGWRVPDFGQARKRSGDLENASRRDKRSAAPDSFVLQGNRRIRGGAALAPAWMTDQSESVVGCIGLGTLLRSGSAAAVRTALRARLPHLLPLLLSQHRFHFRPRLLHQLAHLSLRS